MSSTEITPKSEPPPPLEPFVVWSRSAQWAVAALLCLSIALLTCRAIELRESPKPLSRQRQAFLSQRIDLNKAGRGELVLLPGVGPTLASRIEAYRDQNLKFDSVEQLKEVEGIGPKLLEQIQPWLKVEGEARPSPTPTIPRRWPERTAKMTGTDKPIYLPAATAAELQRIPGIGPVLSERIIAERDREPFRRLGDLQRVRGIGAKTLAKFRPFLTMERKPKEVAKGKDANE